MSRTICRGRLTMPVKAGTAATVTAAQTAGYSRNISSATNSATNDGAMMRRSEQAARWTGRQQEAIAATVIADHSSSRAVGTQSAAHGTAMAAAVAAESARTVDRENPDRIRSGG